jgi:23S rRNA (guanosine2251-2'-O)-methyltransferase
MKAGGSFFEAAPSPTGIYVVLENVRSLFNVGAVFRSADGIGASGVILTGFTGKPPRREISRVALGADENVPWTYYSRGAEAIVDLRKHGISVVALESTDDSRNFREAKFDFPVAFVAGHEVEGVTPETIVACDFAVHIPMMGTKTSLNVSVAAGIALYGLLDASTGQSKDVIDPNG